MSDKGDRPREVLEVTGAGVGFMCAVGKGLPVLPLLIGHRQSIGTSASERALQKGVVVDVLCRNDEVSDDGFIQVGEERVDTSRWYRFFDCHSNSWGASSDFC